MSLIIVLAFPVPDELGVNNFVNSDQPSILPTVSSADSWALALQFAPILRFQSAETYLPIDPQAMLDYASLHSGGNVVRWPPITEGDLGSYNESAAYLSLALNGTSALQLYEMIRQSYSRTVFVHISENETGWVFLQYWIFYLLNAAINTHEGDWEMIQVNLRPGGLPNTFGYSQHLTGRARHWWNTSREGFHPIIYVGKGSHAAYFDPGYHPLADDNCGFTGFDSTGGGVELTVGAGYALVLLAKQSWLSFAGHWGNVTGNLGGDGPSGPWYRTNGCSVRLWDPLPWFATLTQERNGPWPTYYA